MPSFLSGLLYQKDYRQTQLLSQVLLLRNSLEEEDDDNDNNDNDEKKKKKKKKRWTLSEDWALMDNVPRYTVYGGDFDLDDGGANHHHARTFWVQLGSAIPNLNRFSEKDMKQRYSDLLLQRQADAAKNEKKKKNPSKNVTVTSKSIGYSKTKTASTVRCFPSPTLLQDWSIVQRKQHSMMQGCLEDGRTIWFDIQTLGRLGDDPMTGMNGDTNFPTAVYAGGFVEATGGRIYELGMPLKRPTDNNGVVLMNNNNKQKEEQSTSSFLSMLEQNRKPIVVTIVSAALSVALLSAAVGYGAGLALRHEAAASINTNNPTSVVVPSNTLQDQRAKMEAKVLQEQRVVKTLKNRIAEDRMILEQYQKEEIKVGPEQATKPEQQPTENRPGLSLSEKRSRMESRILREERFLDAATKQLSMDGSQLQSLKLKQQLDSSEKLMP